jgi:hypothetical protein
MDKKIYMVKKGKGEGSEPGQDRTVNGHSIPTTVKKLGGQERGGGVEGQNRRVGHFLGAPY